MTCSIGLKLRCHAIRSYRLVGSLIVNSTVSNGASLILGHLREYSKISKPCGVLDLIFPSFS